jgi:hypothetical protein
MLFSPLFLPDHPRDAVAEPAWIQAMLDAEAAPARADRALARYRHTDDSTLDR